MKIGYLMQAGVPYIRTFPLTGPSNHVKNVFFGLNDLGHQVILLAYLDGQIWITDDLTNFKPVFVNSLDRGPFHWLERIVRRLQSQFRLPYAALFESLRFAQACCQELSDCDVLYERMGWVGYGGGIASRRIKIPLVLELNGDHISVMDRLGNAPQGLQRWLSTMLMKQTLHMGSHLVASGDGWREWFVNKWHIDQNKISVVHNGSEIIDLLTRNQLRSFQLSEKPSNRVTVIFIGAFEPWHGISYLLQAIADINSQDIQIHLLLVGSGTQENIIKQQIVDFGIKDKVTLTGQLPPQQVVDHIMNADIGVSPYCDWPEFTGLKTLDYKSAGLAIITSGENGHPKIITHARTGWIVPPCDENALRQAIMYLAQNYEIRRDIGQTARLEAEKLHSWRNTVEQLNNILLQTINASE